ncbi:MAG: hypothetical protein ACQEQL_04190 [Pseudomonadota bacterium]
MAALTKRKRDGLFGCGFAVAGYSSQVGSMSDQDKNNSKLSPRNGNNVYRKSLETILREPLTKQRLMLRSKVRAAGRKQNPKPFTFDEMKSFVSNLPSQRESYQKEVSKALAAVQSGQLASPPDLKCPENQLVWSAALSYVVTNPDVTSKWEPPVEPDKFYESDLWKQTVNSLDALVELREIGSFVNEALRDKGTKYAYGRPGTRTRYDPIKNQLSINFIDSLTSGFEHMRAMSLREIGKALYSKKPTPRMLKLQEEIIPLIRKRDAAKKNRGRGSGLSMDEYKSLRMKLVEFNLRQMLYEAVEKNIRNHFAAERGETRQQDFSVSLNIAGVTSENVGMERAPKSNRIPHALTRYMNLVNAINLDFYQRNNFFPATDKGWRSAGVDPDLVRKVKPGQSFKRDQQGVEHADFKNLRDLIGGEDGLNKKYPGLSQRLFGNFDEKVVLSSEKRNEIIEKISDEYCEPLIKDILDFFSKQYDQKLEEKQKQFMEKEQQKKNNPPRPPNWPPTPQQKGGPHA